MRRVPSPLALLSLAAPFLLSASAHAQKLCAERVTDPFGKKWTRNEGVYEPVRKNGYTHIFAAHRCCNEHLTKELATGNGIRQGVVEFEIEVLAVQRVAR
jgi:hypothetical protein